MKMSINQSIKTLTAPELHNLQELVRELFTLMDNDEEGVMVDVYDLALTAAEILGIDREVSRDA